MKRLSRGTGVYNVLGFADAVKQLVPAVAHDNAHSDEKSSRAEAAGGQITL